MFGAGITNNLVVGFSCFILLILIMGLAIPISQPIIHGVYKDYPAANAGIPSGSVVRGISTNTANQTVSTRQDISALLNTTKPGDSITLFIENNGTVEPYNLTLSQWPNDLSGMKSGFIGVEYYDGTIVMSVIRECYHPWDFSSS